MKGRLSRRSFKGLHREVCSVQAVGLNFDWRLLYNQSLGIHLRSSIRRLHCTKS